MKVRIILILLFSGSFAFGQVKEFDKLEMLYSQQHYKSVYRKSNRLLDKPEYDYSWVPSLYKAMTALQLAENEYWALRHPDAMQEAKELLLDIKRASDGKKVFNAHIYEITSLKSDLYTRLEDFKRRNQKEKFDELQALIAAVFGEVPMINEEPAEDLISDKVGNTQRDQLIQFAKKQLGVPYVWAGNDPSGFDCSGFTSYVMNEFNHVLPRRAVDQYDSSTKIKQKNVQKGDLVFFDNGSGISHVGIIISESNEPLTMIHASSSKGIVITNIETSDYWKSRLKAFGSYLN